MSETPDVAAEDFVDVDEDMPTALPDEAPEADVMEQARGIRRDPDAGGERLSQPDPTDEADEADRQEQSEIVAFDEDDETR